MARREVTGNWTRDDRIAINENFKKLFEEYVGAGLDAAEAKEKAIQAVADSLYAKETAETTRDELTRIIREQTAGGDVVPEVVQARGTHNTVGERLNSISQNLAQTATKKELQAVASGSPKGVFSTLSELQNAHPNGTEGIFVVDETGEWYYWNDAQWISGGVYQASLSSEFPATNEVTNGNFANGTANWLNRDTETTIAIENGNLRMDVISGSTNYGAIINVFDVKANDKYYIKLLLESNVNTDIQASPGTGLTDAKVIDTISTNELTSISNVLSWSASADRMSFGIKPSTTGNSLLFSEVLVINLTKTFGSGLEPTKEEMDNLINTFHNGWFDGTVRPFISQKELYSLMKIKVPDIDSDLAKRLYEDQYGFKYDLDGNLLQNAENEYPITISRNSVSYDSRRNEITVDKPVYEDFKLLNKKGLRISPDTTNVFSENNSVSFTTAETRQLGVGNYVVSIKEGTGKLVLSGGYEGEVNAGEYLTFNLAETASVTFTPTDGTPEYSQLEKQLVPTPWQKGGVKREGDSPRLVLPDTPIGEYGMGMLMRFPLDSNITYPANEYWLLYGHQDADNYFRLIYSTLQQRFSFYQVVNGVTTLVQGKQTPFKANDLMAVYVHVIPGEGIFLYTRKGEFTSVVLTTNASLMPFSSGLKHISIGHRLREESQRAFFANVTVADFRLDINRQPNAYEYFREVL